MAQKKMQYLTQKDLPKKSKDNSDKVKTSK